MPGFFSSSRKNRSSSDGSDRTYENPKMPHSLDSVIFESYQLGNANFYDNGSMIDSTYKTNGLRDVTSIITHPPATRWGRFKDSFKAADMRDLDMMGLNDVEKAAVATANSPLLRQLKGRHIQMIAIGGAIGTGLFIGSGQALHTGGPAALIIGFSLTGMMLFATIQALGELAVAFPVAGAFSTYATRFIDPAWGFAMGWTYTMNWLITFPLELVAAAITIRYWETNGNPASTVNPAAWVSLFYSVIMIINFFGVKGYGEAEFFFSFIKVITIIGYIIFAIIITAGGGPEGYIGGRYWHNPGPFANGFKGLVTVFVDAAFAFAGTELVGLAAAETRNPRKTLPSATKQVFWRITLFYVVSFIMIGFLVPHNDPQLLSGHTGPSTNASPFVISIQNAGVKGLPSVFNVVIMISVLSVANSSVYACSRTMAALAAQGQAPKLLGYIDRNGRPSVAIGVTGIFGLIAFACASGKENEVFTWMYSLSGLACLFTWTSICACHIRFRQGLKVQGRTTKELPFTSAVGVWGSYFGFTLNCVVFCAQIWVGLYPVGATSADVRSFFKIFLAVPIMLMFYIPYKLYFKTKFVNHRDMDLNTGRREVDLDLLELEIAEENERIRAKGWIYRTYKFWC